MDRCFTPEHGSSRPGSRASAATPRSWLSERLAERAARDSPTPVGQASDASVSAPNSTGGGAAAQNRNKRCSSSLSGNSRNAAAENSRCASVPRRPVAPSGSYYPPVPSSAEIKAENEEMVSAPPVSSLTPFASWGGRWASILDKAARLHNLPHRSEGERYWRCHSPTEKTPPHAVSPKVLTERSSSRATVKRHTRVRKPREPTAAMWTGTRTSTPKTDGQDAKTKAEKIEKTRPTGIDMMKNKVVEKLEAILQDDFFKTKDLSMDEKKVYKDVADSLNLLVFTVAESKDKLLILHEGAYCEEIRQQLAELVPGHHAVLTHLTEGMLLLAKKVVEELKLWVHRDGITTMASEMKMNNKLFSIEIWHIGRNLGEWRDGLYSKIQALTEEDFSFPPGLSDQRCNIICEVVNDLMDLGYVCAVEGQGRVRRVHVGLIGPFLSVVHRDLKSILPGSTTQYQEGMTFLKRKAIERLVKRDSNLRFSEAKSRASLQLTAAGVTMVSDWVVTVSRQKGDYEDELQRVADLGAKKDEVGRRLGMFKDREEPEIGDYAPIPTPTGRSANDWRDPSKLRGEKKASSRFEKLFRRYATGMRETSRFLRKCDLRRLLNVAKQDAPDEHRKALNNLELQFDDILNLQFLLGTNEHDGLTESAFQALVGKVAKEHGWEFVGQLKGTLK